MCDHCGCRAFPPVAELTAEHETILDLAWTLAETSRVTGHAAPAVERELLALLDRHVVKEETGLYPALVATGAVSEGDVSDLEAEHRDLRRSLTDGGFDRRDFYALAAHIEDEEMELFPAAMLGFDDEEWGATSDAHRAVDAAAAAAT
jgi:hemerythrin-like domain-containing protein